MASIEGIDSLYLKSAIGSLKRISAVPSMVAITIYDAWPDSTERDLRLVVASDGNTEDEIIHKLEMEFESKVELTISSLGHSHSTSSDI